MDSICARCGTEVAPGAMVCRCGHRLADAAPSDAAPSLLGELKRSALFEKARGHAAQAAHTVQERVVQHVDAVAEHQDRVLPRLDELCAETGIQPEEVFLGRLARKMAPDEQPLVMAAGQYGGPFASQDIVLVTDRQVMIAYASGALTMGVVPVPTVIRTSLTKVEGAKVNYGSRRDRKRGRVSLEIRTSGIGSRFWMDWVTPPESAEEIVRLLNPAT